MSIATNLQTIRDQIIAAERDYSRKAHSVQLIAVSKGQDVDAIAEAIDCGQMAFGENYVQEALPKIKYFAAYPLEWHFMGTIQTNKTRLIAEHFHWVHSIDNLKIAEHLNRHRPAHLSPLNICLQINISREMNKSGINLSDVELLAHQVTQLSKLKLRGLMAIPAITHDFEQQRATFKKMYLVLQQLNTSGFALDTLSIGMSDDFIAAIAEGATMVRIGTAIFGQRK